MVARFRLPIKLCLVLFLGQFIEARNDFHELDPMPLRDMALTICESNDSSKLFVTFALTSHLKGYISTSPDPRLAECWSKHGDSLELAERIVRTSNDDICSDEKISLIEEFHHKYISINPRDSNNRELNQKTAPQILKTFFVLYVQRLGQVCKNVLRPNLEDMAAKDELVAGMTERKEHMPFDDILDRFSQSFMFELSADKQKYMFLLWSLVEDIAYESREKVDFSKYVDLAEDLKPGQVYRVTVKMSNVDAIRSLQDYCRQHLRPSYSRTVLPVIRLTTLGYYYPDIETIPSRWYKATQLCETILPIRFVADTSLAPGQVVLVPKGEVEQEDTEISYPNLEPKPNFYLNILNCHSLWWTIKKSNVDQIWKDIKNRKNIVKRYLSKIASKALAVTDRKDGSFFLASKRSEGGGKHDFTEALGESLAELSEPTSAEKRQEKLHKFGRGLLSGMKKAAHIAKLVLLGALKVVGCILALIALFLIPDFSKDQGGPMFLPPASEGGGGGGGGGGSMPVTLMAVPIIG